MKMYTGGEYVKFPFDYFDFAKERYNVLLKRQAGLPKPWTDDPILQEYRFCNVQREDDKVTVWFRDHFREPNRDKQTVLFGTIAFRFFNTISTGQILLDNDLLENWDPDLARKVLKDQKPLVTGAYMVKTPTGKTKLEGLIEILDAVWKDRRNLIRDFQAADTLEMAHKRLLVYPFIGPFMAYEFVTDLRHTYFLEKATDIMTWGNPGPGAMRGLAWVMFNNTDRLPKASDMLPAMQELLALSHKWWPKEFPAWEMREVEHWLCETDKYLRTVKGDSTPKQRYQGK